MKKSIKSFQAKMTKSQLVGNTKTVKGGKSDPPPFGTLGGGVSDPPPFGTGGS